MKSLAQQRREKWQNFLRTFFNKEGYEEKEVNGWMLVKQGGGTEIVSVYSPEDFKKYKEYKNGKN